MFSWIAANIGTILICLVLLLVVTAIIVCLVRDKKKGKPSCGGNCAHCAMSGSCHKQSPPGEAQSNAPPPYFSAGGYPWQTASL